MLTLTTMGDNMKTQPHVKYSKPSHRTVIIAEAEGEWMSGQVSEQERETERAKERETDRQTTALSSGIKQLETNWLLDFNAI